MICSIISTGFERALINKNEYEEPYLSIKKQLFEIISSAQTDGADSFYINSEYGIPLWTAEIICTLKKVNNISLNIIVPYEEQAAQWSENLRDRYFAVHEKADTIRFASTQYYNGCYATADKLLAEYSDIVYIFGSRIETVPMLRYMPADRIRWVLM